VGLIPVMVGTARSGLLTNAYLAVCPLRLTPLSVALPGRLKDDHSDHMSRIVRTSIWKVKVFLDQPYFYGGQRMR